MKCKFVVLEVRGTILIIAGCQNVYPYHANLIYHYCSEEAIPCSWVTQPSLAKVSDSSVTIRGGGWLDIYPGQAKAVFHGRSTAYGRFQRTDVEQALSQNGALGEYQISFER